jgi:predicted DsbA family dithiol-disulfide isomerase
LKREFPLEDTWLSFELHPETPPQGRLLAELFPGRDMSASQEYLRRAAATYELPFAPADRLSNTRLAIEASEFARDQDRHDAYSRRLFTAYFVEGEDIGDLEALVRLAAESGVEVAGLREALQTGTYGPRRDAAAAEARRLAVTGVPAFFLPHMMISGAQPLEVFRRALAGVAPSTGG